MDRDKLIAIFMVDGPPYLLEYKRLGRARQDWKAALPILKEMMKGGLVKEIERTRTTILYRYEPKP